MTWQAEAAAPAATFTAETYITVGHPWGLITRGFSSVEAFSSVLTFGLEVGHGDPYTKEYRPENRANWQGWVAQT